MSDPIVLTGLSHGKHKFNLSYPEVDGNKICIAKCDCGYEVEIMNFHNYGGIKDLQKKWEMHIGTWKGWVQINPFLIQLFSQTLGEPTDTVSSDVYGAEHEMP